MIQEPQFQLSMIKCVKQTALWYIYSILGKGVHDVLGVRETESVLETPQANNSTLSDTFMDEFLYKKRILNFLILKYFVIRNWKGNSCLNVSLL